MVGTCDFRRPFAKGLSGAGPIQTPKSPLQLEVDWETVDGEICHLAREAAMHTSRQPLTVRAPGPAPSGSDIKDEMLIFDGHGLNLKGNPVRIDR